MEQREKLRFTPGPWRVATKGDKAYHATDTSVVKDVTRDDDHQYDLVGICSTGGEWHCDYFEKVANANLISAAPEMYEWQEEVLEILRRLCRSLNTDDYIRERLEPLIYRGEQIGKKARGEE